MDKIFRLKENNVTVGSEIVCGIATCLTMMYILYVNSSILSTVGMPFHGVFIATALTAAICSFIVAFYANLPLAMAPGMGINAFFVQVICIRMGFHWREALAITFISGILHLLIVTNPRLRRSFLNAIPNHLKIAAGAGLGFFIAYEGIKSAGFLTFASNAGSYIILENDVVLTDSTINPGFVESFNISHILLLVSLVTMVVLKMLERKTGDKYAVIPIAILLATFVGIPLNVTSINSAPIAEVSIYESFTEVFAGFFGETGLFSLFSDAGTTIKTIFIVLVMTCTGMMNSIATITGVGLIGKKAIIDKNNLKNIPSSEPMTKYEKAMIAESFGGVVAPLFGSSAAVSYAESAAGVSSGARTGLTSLTVGIIFLLIIPFIEFSYIIPSEALAVVLIFVGTSMLLSIRRINWRKIEEFSPALLTMTLMPLSYDVFSGLTAGIIVHIVFQLVLGNWKKINPTLYIIVALFLTYKIIDI